MPLCSYQIKRELYLTDAFYLQSWGGVGTDNYISQKANPCSQKKKTHNLIWILGNTKNLSTEVILDCPPTAITQGWGPRFSTLLWHRPQSILSQLHHTHTDSLLPSRSQSCPSPPSPFNSLWTKYSPHISQSRFSYIVLERTKLDIHLSRLNGFYIPIK